MIKKKKNVTVVEEQIQECQTWEECINIKAIRGDFGDVPEIPIMQNKKDLKLKL